ncbi:pseudouridine synthase [Chitinimonas sp. BJB300]|uniref:pseudouridine synthase n=1 Tax=Chitinimonas sp. BJB300 TaxID=1559339 RepID=UPI000C0DC7BF|nr:pseudouridine synthase [Chitinimonas sp. BJB300]PHV11655.1 23S rRNA pseudouridylate synthase B [Chitinimonas sp. BJB300]TSJ85576.1 pseudouridine synthase [Chitinimonas sp. BJB300]
MAPPRKPSPKSPAGYAGSSASPRGSGRARPQSNAAGSNHGDARGQAGEGSSRGRARGNEVAAPRGPRSAPVEGRYGETSRDSRRTPVDGNRSSAAGPRTRSPEGGNPRGPRNAAPEGRYGEPNRDGRRAPVDGNRAPAPSQRTRPQEGVNPRSPRSGPEGQGRSEAGHTARGGQGGNTRGDGRGRPQGDAPAADGRKRQFEQHFMGGRAFSSVEDRQRKRYGDEGAEPASRGDRTARPPRDQSLDADARRELRKANSVQAAPVVERAKKLRVRRGSEKQEADAQQLREKRVETKYIGELRIQKALALSGVGSRRDCDEWVTLGRVSINGKLAEPGSRVTPGDQVRFDGKQIDIKWPDRLPRIVMYHKQEGELVSRDDPEGRTTVFDRLPKVQSSAWVAVGRLDFNTSGLLIFTTSGDLANRMMHPSFEVEREYAVRVLGSLTEEQRQQMLDGIELEDGTASFQVMQDQGGEGINHWYRVILKEGRNREVRRMFEHFELTVSRLMRVRFGMLTLPSRLKRGQYYELDEREVLTVLKWAGLNMAGRTPDR